MQLIRLLADGEFHSGEEIGRQLGVSRAAVWKQLQKLADLGLRWSSTKGKGYALDAPIELLDRQYILDCLESNVATQVTTLEVLPVLNSTSSYLLEQLSQGAATKGAVCFAEYQQAGRGRRGRQWHSPFGFNLYFSLLWQFEQGAAALEGLSLAVGVAIAQVLRNEGVDVQLKWPNDLLVGDAKLGGILLEMAGDPSGSCQVVVGVGLNVAMPSNDYIDQPWTSAAVSVPDISRNRLAGLLVNQLIPVLNTYPESGFLPYKSFWNRWDAYADRPAKLIAGEKVTKGIVRGVADQGALLLEVDGVVTSIYGGELSLRANNDS